VESFTDSTLTLSTEHFLGLAATLANYSKITSGFFVLVPVAGTQSTGGLPQEFLVQTPEPDAFYMLLGGISLIGIGRIVRRKRAA